MSERVGDSRNQPEDTGLDRPSERSMLAGAAAGYPSEKWAAMPRRERRAAERAARRRR